MSDKGMEMYSTVYNILLQKPGLSIEETMELYFEAKGGYTKEQVKQYILNYGFIISDNVEMTSYEVADTGFAYSDHQPVIMKFMLK